MFHFITHVSHEVSCERAVRFERQCLCIISNFTSNSLKNIQHQSTHGEMKTEDQSGNAYE